MYNPTQQERDALRLVPELRHFAMAAAGNPCMEAIMNCVAAGVAYGIDQAIKQDN